MNQEEDGQHYLYEELIYPVGADSFVEMNALKFLHKYSVTHNNRLLSRFSCQSNKDLRPSLHEYRTIQ